MNKLILLAMLLPIMAIAGEVPTLKCVNLDCGFVGLMPQPNEYDPTYYDTITDTHWVEVRVTSARHINEQVLYNGKPVYQPVITRKLCPKPSMWVLDSTEVCDTVWDSDRPYWMAQWVGGKDTGDSALVRVQKADISCRCEYAWRKKTTDDRLSIVNDPIRFKTLWGDATWIGDSLVDRLTDSSYTPSPPRWPPKPDCWDELSKGFDVGYDCGKHGKWHGAVGFAPDLGLCDCCGRPADRFLLTVEMCFDCAAAWKLYDKHANDGKGCIECP